MFNLLYDLFLWPFEKLGLKKRRSYLLQLAQGNVLELGVGTGLNLSHYGPKINLQAIDLDPKSLPKAQKKARHLSIKFQIGDVEKLPFPDNHFDVVVATLLFCSVKSPLQGFTEVQRVLRPGGQFLLLEHVRPPGFFLAKIFDLLTPLWKRLAHGCHLNRRTEDLILHPRLNFELLRKEIFWRGVGLVCVLQKRTSSP